MTWGSGVGCGYCQGYWPPERLCRDGLPFGEPGVLHDQRPSLALVTERSYQLLATREAEGFTLEGADDLDLIGQCSAMVVALGVVGELADQIVDGADFGPGSLGAMMRNLSAAIRPVEQLLASTLGAAGVNIDASVTWSPRGDDAPCR